MYLTVSHLLAGCSFYDSVVVSFLCENPSTSRIMSINIQRESKTRISCSNMRAGALGALICCEAVALRPRLIEALLFSRSAQRETKCRLSCSVLRCDSFLKCQSVSSMYLKTSWSAPHRLFTAYLLASVLLRSNWDEPRERRKNLEPSQKLSSFIHKPRRESHRRLTSSPQTLPEESCSFPFFVFVPRRVYIWTRHYILIVLLITIQIKYSSGGSRRRRFFYYEQWGQFGMEACGCSKEGPSLI